MKIVVTLSSNSNGAENTLIDIEVDALPNVGDIITLEINNKMEYFIVTQRTHNIAPNKKMQHGVIATRTL